MGTPVETSAEDTLPNRFPIWECRKDKRIENEADAMCNLISPAQIHEWLYKALTR